MPFDASLSSFSPASDAGIGSPEPHLRPLARNLIPVLWLRPFCRIPSGAPLSSSVSRNFMRVLFSFCRFSSFFVRQNLHMSKIIRTFALANRSSHLTPLKTSKNQGLHAAYIG